MWSIVPKIRDRMGYLLRWIGTQMSAAGRTEWEGLNGGQESKPQSSDAKRPPDADPPLYSAPSGDAPRAKDAWLENLRRSAPHLVQQWQLSEHNQDTHASSLPAWYEQGLNLWGTPETTPPTMPPESVDRLAAHPSSGPYQWFARWPLPYAEASNFGFQHSGIDQSGAAHSLKPNAKQSSTVGRGEIPVPAGVGNGSTRVTACGLASWSFYLADRRATRFDHWGTAGETGGRRPYGGIQHKGWQWAWGLEHNGVEGRRFEHRGVEQKPLKGGRHPQGLSMAPPHASHSNTQPQPLNHSGANQPLQAGPPREPPRGTAPGAAPASAPLAPGAQRTCAPYNGNNKSSRAADEYPHPNAFSPLEPTGATIGATVDGGVSVGSHRWLGGSSEARHRWHDLPPTVGRTRPVISIGQDHDRDDPWPSLLPGPSAEDDFGPRDDAWEHQCLAQEQRGL